MSKITIVEVGEKKDYILDGKEKWTIGRLSRSSNPDIKLSLKTISRNHGLIRNIDGIWFYVDSNGKNGTVYKNKKIKPGLNGNVRPVMLNDGDELIFGGSEKAIICSNTVWAMFSTKDSDKYDAKVQKVIKLTSNQ